MGEAPLEGDSYENSEKLTARGLDGCSAATAADVPYERERAKFWKLAAECEHEREREGPTPHELKRASWHKFEHKFERERASGGWRARERGHERECE